MRPFLMCVSVLVLSLATADAVRAEVIVRVRRDAPRRTVVVTGRPVRPYYAIHGTRFAGGWYYRGFQHRHWTYTCWSRQYRAAFYWDPFVRGYYYWYAPADSYYPVTSLQLAPPVVSPGGAPPIGVPQVDGIPPAPALSPPPSVP